MGVVFLFILAACTEPECPEIVPGGSVDASTIDTDGEAVFVVDHAFVFEDVYIGDEDWQYSAIITNVGDGMPDGAYAYLAGGLGDKEIQYDFDNNELNGLAPGDSMAVNFTLRNPFVNEFDSAAAGITLDNGGEDPDFKFAIVLTAIE